MLKLLFADDESALRETVKDYFEAKGFSVLTAKNGNEAVLAAEKDEFDIIILDVMMPRKDGLAACREIREIRRCPVLMLSALSAEKDYLGGYGSGADDYIAKPFPLSVLYEKCMAMIRRSGGAGKITRGGITLDADRRSVYADGRELPVRGMDFDLLAYLMNNAGIVLSREIILTRIWGYDFDGDERAVDSHIKSLRKALGNHADRIKTVIGTGYRFEEDIK